jgi:hypothetical protein
MQLSENQYSINLAFTDDGKSLIYNGSGDPMIRAFDAKSGKQLRERPHSNAPKEPLPPRGKDGESRYRNPFVAFAPTGRLMAAYDATFNKVELVDPSTGERPAHLEKVQIGYYGYMSFSGDGKLLAHSSYWQRAIQIWNMETGQLVKTLSASNHRKDKDKGDGYTNLRFSHDNKFVMGYSRGSSGNDTHVAIYGVEDGLEYARLPISAYHLEMSPDNRMLISGSGGYFVLYDLVADKKIDKIKLPASHFYNTQRTPDGMAIALLGGAGRVNEPYSVYLATFPILGDDGLPAGRLTAEDERDLWTGLCSSNLFRRRYVSKILKSHPDQAVQMTEERVKVVPKATRQKIDELIKALDDADFERRDAAVKELRPEAFRFEPLLQETLKAAPAGEVKNRVAFVLNTIRDQATPAELHSDLRGIELLETLATPPARKALEALADGAAGARITMEAASALKRVASGK